MKTSIAVNSASNIVVLRVFIESLFGYLLYVNQYSWRPVCFRVKGLTFGADQGPCEGAP